MKGCDVCEKSRTKPDEIPIQTYLIQIAGQYNPYQTMDRSYRMAVELCSVCAMVVGTEINELLNVRTTSRIPLHIDEKGLD